MDYKISQQAAESLKKQKKHKQYLGVLACLAVLVTVGTVLAFKFTGQAMNKKVKALDCQLEVHQHDATCYNEKNELICGLADYVVHTHDQGCYDEEGNLVCTLPEIQEHKHTAQCFVESPILVCTEEETPGHIHDDSCYAEQAALVCSMEEHTHVDACLDEDGNLICGMEEHTHSSDCYQTEKVPVCGIEEGAGGHHHGEACYKMEKTAVCGKLELHKHDKNLCYDAEGKLICKETVLEQHVHTDACFKEVSVEEAAALKEEAASVKKQTAETENYIVEVTYGDDAELPENAALTVVEYASDSEEFKSAVEQLGYEPEWLLDISFMDGDVEVEPKTNVKVTVINKNKSEVSNYDIVHFNDDNTLEDISGIGIETADGTGAAFSMSSFSPVAGTPALLAAGADYTVDVNSTVSISGTKPTSGSNNNTNNTWKSSDTTIATVSGNKNVATVTGKKAGTVTITHTYRTGTLSTKSETFTVEVLALTPTPTPTPDPLTSKIILKHIQTPNDSYDVGKNVGKNVMKYSIVLVNTDGTISYNLPAGSIVPDEYVYNGTSMDVATALNEMGMTIPGYTMQNGYAFFWWSGNYNGTMFKVPTIMNNKVISTNYPGYTSNLAFEGLQGSVKGDGKEASYEAYINATFADKSNGDDYSSSSLTGYAYNPTGTLRIVFFQVSDKASYKTKFVDAFRGEDETAFSVVDEINMQMSRGTWTQGTTSYDWTGNADTITDKTPAARTGYIFEGWYTDKDEYGNGTGTKVEYVPGETVTVKDSSGNDTQIAKTTDPNEVGNISDKTYYAKWVPKKDKTTVEKVWDDGNNANRLRPSSVVYRISASGLQGGVEKPVALTAADVPVSTDVAIENGAIKVTLSADNEWKKELSLPETVMALDDGATLTYTVTEDPIADTTWKNGDTVLSAYHYTASETAFDNAHKTYSITNTGALREPINFYLNLKSEILNYDGSSQITQATNKFTTSVFNSEVLLPKEYTHPTVVNHANPGSNKEAVVLQSSSPDTAFAIDQAIRTIGAGQGYSDGTYTYVMKDAFPSDEEIFATIRNNWTTVTKGKGLSVNDTVIQDPSVLTTENFECRWYVFKDNSGDAWHVDGILVPKTGTLTVTKTFDNVGQAAAAKAADFEIAASGTFVDGVVLTQDLLLDDDCKTVADDGTVTYTWSFEVVKATYTLSEQNYDALGGFTYNSTENTVTQKTGGSWQTTAGTSTDVNIACVTKATDDTTSQNQAVTFTNHYTSQIKVVKVSDQNSDVPLVGAVFTLTNAKNETQQLVSDEDGVVYDGEIAEGQYLLTEQSAPAGYMKMTTPVTITISNGSVTAAIVGSTTGVSIDKNTDGSYRYDDDGNIVIRVTNTRGTELPSTGGSGTLPYTFAGLFIIAIGLMYVALIRRRRV